MTNNFSSLEKNIAKTLRRHPFLKDFVKAVYARLMYFFHKKPMKLISDYDVYSIKKEGFESFFGYYDKSPDNGSGLVLVHLSENDTRKKPNKYKYIELDVYSLSEGKFLLNKPIVTKAYNWQQGSRLHWLNKDCFIYNDYIDGKYCAVVYSSSSQERLYVLDHPVQDSYKDKYFLSINYEVLSDMRPDYGYFSHTRSKNEEKGIIRYDFKDDVYVKVVDLDDVLRFEFSDDVSYKHKLNHIMISPDGDKFIFMHRYYNQAGQRFDRLLLSNKDGQILKLLSLGSMVSHCHWIDNDTIIGYLTGLDNKDCYWTININSGEYLPHLALNKMTSTDGHPSVSSNGDIVTDTYPNKARLQSLYYLENGKDQVSLLAQFFHGFEFTKETRCDLHPRLSKNADMVFFDTVYSSKRILSYINLQKTDSKKNE